MGIGKTLLKNAIKAAKKTAQENEKQQQRIKNQEKYGQLQDYLFPGSGTTLVKTPKQIENALIKFLNAHSKTIEDLNERINSADDPKAFFDTVDKYRKTAREIEAVKGLASNIMPISFEYNLEAVLPGCINGMMDRCWQKYQLRAIKSTSNGAKNKQYQIFFEMMDLFKDKLFPENISHLEDIRKTINN